MNILNKSEINDLSTGAIKCDGTVNCYISLKDGTDIELYGLSLKQADSIEAWYKDKKKTSLRYDERLTVRSEELWMAQNGIRGVK